MVLHLGAMQMKGLEVDKWWKSKSQDLEVFWGLDSVAVCTGWGPVHLDGRIGTQVPGEDGSAELL